jgi:hypothetical protein
MHHRDGRAARPPGRAAGMLIAATIRPPPATTVTDCAQTPRPGLPL